MVFSMQEVLLVSLRPAPTLLGRIVGTGAAVYLTAVVEYLTAEILELSGNAARDHRSWQILPRHLMLAVRNDEELNKMFRNCRAEVLGGGVLPNIYAVLLPPRCDAGEEDPEKQEAQAESIMERFKYEATSDAAGKRTWSFVDEDGLTEEEMLATFLA